MEQRRPTTRPPRERANPALRLAAVRQWHSYLGVAIAPSVLFFALTGALQLFTLHEAHGDYRPPQLIEKLGMVHKDQVYALKPKRAAPPGSAPDAVAKPKPAAPAQGPKASTWALKSLFLGVALSLVTLTCLGLWMALRYGRRKRLAWGLLVAGAAVPVLILML
jgi:hypothetical protein